MSRWVSTVLALVVGFGIGWFVLKAKRAELGSGNQVVHVYEDPNDGNRPHVHPEEATISYGDFVFWVSDNAKKNVRVEFTDEVFYGMTQLQNHRWQPNNCKGPNCASGAVKAGAGRYKYWQILEDPGGANPKEKDGWIIIQP